MVRYIIVYGLDVVRYIIVYGLDVVRYSVWVRYGAHIVCGLDDVSNGSLMGVIYNRHSLEGGHLRWDLTDLLETPLSVASPPHTCNAPSLVLHLSSMRASGRMGGVRGCVMGGVKGCVRGDVK